MPKYGVTTKPASPGNGLEGSNRRMAHGHARIFAGQLGWGLDVRNGHRSSHDMHKRRRTNSALCSLESNEYGFCLDPVVSRYSCGCASAGIFGVDFFPILIVNVRLQGISQLRRKGRMFLFLF